MDRALRTLLGDMVAATSLTDCLQSLADSRNTLGFGLVGFRDLVDVPAVERLERAGLEKTRFGWSPSFLDSWKKANLGRSFPLPDELRQPGRICKWRLPDLDRGTMGSMSAAQRKAVRMMRSYGIDGGISVTLRRPFGGVGCVTWFAPHDAESDFDPDQRRLLHLFATQFFEGLDRWGLRETISPLTMRETEVLYLASRGSTDEQIAQSIGRTANTVRFHIKSIIRKLGAANRTHAVAIAVEAGLFREPAPATGEA